MKVRYIHEHQEWPEFRWEAGVFAGRLTRIAYLAGVLAGRLESLGFEDRNEAVLDAAVADIIGSSAIEGERLDPRQVRSSVARSLGMEFAGLPIPARQIQGIVAMALDATERYTDPLTPERLFGWHAALFPTGYSGLFPVRVGGWRDDAKGAMQVISGTIGRETVHFEAPTAARIPSEMASFLTWFEGDNGLDPYLKAAIAHLWFVTIHPFDDGNGRIGRAILDMALARAERTARRAYSLSAGILARRDGYYSVLEEAQKGDLDVTGYLVWFLDLFGEVLEGAEGTIGRSLWRSHFWHVHREMELNERQRRVLVRLLGDFQGDLTNEKWRKLTHATRDTALRDLNDLVAKGIFTAEGQGRGARYRLVGTLPDPVPGRGQEDRPT